jgi:chromosome segregation ATPase
MVILILTKINVCNIMQAANEKLAQATNDCSEALSALNETKTQINRQRTQVKRLKLENQTQDHKQNSQSLNKDRRPRSKLDDLLYSRYCYCKALLADLRATATSPENQIRNKTVVVCGMLVDHLQLAGNEYSTAVKTVLGG